jgi:hypothetical protein
MRMSIDSRGTAENEQLCISILAVHSISCTVIIKGSAWRMCCEFQCLLRQISSGQVTNYTCEANGTWLRLPIAVCRSL